MTESKLPKNRFAVCAVLPGGANGIRCVVSVHATYEASVQALARMERREARREDRQAHSAVSRSVGYRLGQWWYV